MCSFNNMLSVDIEIDDGYRAACHSGISGDIILFVMIAGRNPSARLLRNSRASLTSRFSKDSFEEPLTSGKHPFQIRVTTMLRIVLKDFEKQLDIHP